MSVGRLTLPPLEYSRVQAQSQCDEVLFDFLYLVPGRRRGCVELDRYYCVYFLLYRRIGISPTFPFHPQLLQEISTHAKIFANL